MASKRRNMFHKNKTQETTENDSNFNMTSADSTKPPQKGSGSEVKKKLPYPKSVFFIISNEFCERFSYYGMRTILALYLHKSLGFSEDMSTVVYHVFVMLCYFTPLLGGIIADSWLGKYRTIFYVSCIYAVGNIVLAVGSVSSLNISHKAMSLVGLFLIAAGTGGIKPCVSSFGGDQFVMPEQERQLQGFFSVFYFTINAGSVLSCFFTPMLREQVSCLGQETCDPLAFGVPAVLMVISIMFFVGGRRMYKMKDPEGNIMSLVCKCIGHAISRKISRKKGEGREHWLDYADDIYPKRLIEETKIFINLAILFSPTIVFWALYEQQGSRWTFQASHMDGNLGGYYLDPDQIQTLNPVLVLIFIPIFDKGFYPLLAKLRIIRTPLQKLSWGGLLGALAFLVSGLVELKIQPSYPVLAGSGEAHLRVYNTLQCDIGLNYMNNDGVVNQLGMLERLALPVVGNTTVQLKMTGRDYCKTYKAVETSFVLQEMEIASLLITNEGETLKLIQLMVNGQDEVQKSPTIKVNPKIKVVYGHPLGSAITFSNGNNKLTQSLTSNNYQTNITDELPSGKYDVSVDKTKIVSDLNLQTGAVYTLMLTNNKDTPYKLFEITPPNTVSILWQIPQYFIITFAEIMFSITGMEFSFTQSPESMKSVISSLWLITDAFGNIIILIIAGINIFDNKAYEFFLYAALMAVVMGIFIILAMKYKYIALPPDENYEKERPVEINSEQNQQVTAA